jgi:hypothetical protein
MFLDNKNNIDDDDDDDDDDDNSNDENDDDHSSLFININTLLDSTGVNRQVQCSREHHPRFV